MSSSGLIDPSLVSGLREPHENKSIRRCYLDAVL